MKAKSTVNPNPVEVTKIGNKARVRLTKNVEAITEDSEVLYQYDEVVFEMNYLPGLISKIEADFETYFNFGIQTMNLKESLKVKENEIKRLIDKQELPEELENLMLGIVETYENLNLETLQNSLAIAEIYETILLGGED